MNFLFLSLLSCFFLLRTTADIPVHCLYADYYGEWKYFLGPAGGDNTIDCSAPFSPELGLQIKLSYPDVSLDQVGNSGFWTRIYDEGVEVVLNGKKYFAFSYYDDNGYDCSKTLQGWYHDADGTNWGCFYAEKVTSSGPDSLPPSLASDQKTRSSALPEYHPHYERVADPSYFELPAEFDWRNVNGVNYVTPVRDQGHCGSCYAFSTLAMFEARIRIMTNNKQQPILSTQNIVSCSEYSQGCDGGFPYLIEKYGQDFSFYEDSCLPYTAQDTPCSPCDLSQVPQYRATGYYYVGGYYGACSAEEMRMELYVNGPIVVGFEVYSDFHSYTGGVYVHNTTSAIPTTNPWEMTSHAVTIVGWGEDSSGVPFWTVKNSWGASWGEGGYFRIRRNTDECGIESMASAATPILPN